MFRTLANAFKNKEVRTKLLLTLLLLFIYRVGCWIPTPGLDVAALGADNASIFGETSFLGLLNSITGDGLSNGALLALGISPYINASIIAQLLTIAIPPLERWTKQGDEGKRKMAMFTRVLTVLLAVVQTVGILVSFARGGYINTAIYGISIPSAVVYILIGVVLIAGAVFTMWLGERITDLGIGNGISLLIFVGILSTAGLAIVNSISIMATGGEEAEMQPWYLLIFLVMVVFIFGFITFIDGAERKIPVSYAKQIKGRKQFGGQNTHIPIKVNASGVLPIIFATAIITFPQLIMQMVGSDMDNWWTNIFGTGSPGYYALSALLILFFSYFYAMIQFKPDEVARNLQQYGGFIPGIRPGRATQDYLSKVNKRLTLFGAIYLAVIFIIPSLLFSILNVTINFNSALTNAFSSTGMLIVVSVALEFQKQLDNQLLMRQYRGFLKQ
ncbi:MAG TPA: preprotein translocase subunit SecY [Firmicutes bacterium]|nr:preprotein translocase subunit SecY [Bacillota bacterium]